MGFDLDTIAYTVSVWTIPVLLAVTLHEAAHGWVAMRLGDPRWTLVNGTTLSIIAIVATPVFVWISPTMGVVAWMS